MFTSLWLSFIIAFVVSFIMTPVAIKIAPKIGAMDIPKDQRRMHSKAMPRFGGLAIFTGTTVAMAAIMHSSEKMMVILLGGILIYALGVVDDLKNLNAKLKFLYQTGVAVLMYFLGIRINFISNFFGVGRTDFGVALTFIVTIFWIVGITNTVNLIDGLDGLAAGVSSISSLCIAYVAYIHGMYEVTAGMLALAGGCLGFLPKNFYPAKVFMGDGGSLFLGFMLATLSTAGTVKSATLVAIIIPVLVLGLPIFDTAFAIFRRLINKQGIMTADKGHLHHRLMSLGYGQRRATLMLYCVAGIMGVASVTFSRDLYVETIGLFSITALMIYIFLTDAQHTKPVIKKEELEKETKTPGEIADKEGQEYDLARELAMQEKKVEELKEQITNIDKNN